jgi:hypothetical protein
MADRKQTPDILGEILGGEASTTTPAPGADPELAPKSSPGRKSHPRKSSRRSKPKLQPWEYMEVVFRDYGGYRPRYVNGEEQVDWKQAPVIHEYLNQLGEQGWELAGVGSRDDMQMPAYFKRHKAF